MHFETGLLEREHRVVLKEKRIPFNMLYSLKVSAGSLMAVARELSLLPDLVENGSRSIDLGAGGGMLSGQRSNSCESGMNMLATVPEEGETVIDRSDQGSPDDVHPKSEGIKKVPSRLLLGEEVDCDSEGATSGITSIMGSEFGGVAPSSVGKSTCYSSLVSRAGHNRSEGDFVNGAFSSAAPEISKPTVTPTVLALLKKSHMLQTLQVGRKCPTAFEIDRLMRVSGCSGFFLLMCTTTDHDHAEQDIMGTIGGLQYDVLHSPEPTWAAGAVSRPCECCERSSRSSSPTPPSPRRPFSENISWKEISPPTGPRTGAPRRLPLNKVRIHPRRSRPSSIISVRATLTC